MNDKLYQDYLSYCYHVGEKPSHANVLHEFVKGVKNETLVKCDCCNVYQKEEHLTTAKYDYDKLVCPDCSHQLK